MGGDSDQAYQIKMAQTMWGENMILTILVCSVFEKTVWQGVANSAVWKC